MNKLLIASLLLSLPAAALATEHRLERDGQTFVYRSETRNGATVLTGKRWPGGRDFRLFVKNGRVRGVAGGWPVAFAVTDARRQAPPAIAAR